MGYLNSDLSNLYIMCMNHCIFTFFYELKSGDQIFCQSIFDVNIDNLRLSMCQIQIPKQTKLFNN